MSIDQQRLQKVTSRIGLLLQKASARGVDSEILAELDALRGEVGGLYLYRPAGDANPPPAGGQCPKCGHQC